MLSASAEARPAAHRLLGPRSGDPAHRCAAHERRTSITRAARDALEETSLASLLGPAAA